MIESRQFTDKRIIGATYSFHYDRYPHSFTYEKYPSERPIGLISRQVYLPNNKPAVMTDIIITPDVGTIIYKNDDVEMLPTNELRKRFGDHATQDIPGVQSYAFFGGPGFLIFNATPFRLASTQFDQGLMGAPSTLQRLFSKKPYTEVSCLDTSGLFGRVQTNYQVGWARSKQVFIKSLTASDLFHAA